MRSAKIITAKLIGDLMPAALGGALVSLAVPVPAWRCAIAGMGLYLIAFAMWRPE